MSSEEVERMPDVELSSDSEDDGENEDGVALIVFKRPALVQRIVEDVEVRFGFIKIVVFHCFYSQIVPVTERDPADSGNFKTKPRVGIIKEYIGECESVAGTF